MPHNHIQEASGIMSISIFLTAAILACVASEGNILSFKYYWRF